MSSFTLYGASQEDYKLMFKEIKLDDFLNVISSGDLIFSRSESVPSRIIQWSAHCIWNHVAMCLEVEDEVGGANRDMTKYWFESTPTCYSTKDFPGVKRWPIRERLMEILLLQGRSSSSFLHLGVSKLNCSSSLLKEVICKKMVQFWESENGKPYNGNLKDLVLSWLDSISTLTRRCFPCCYDSSPLYYDTLECKKDEYNQWGIFKSSESIKEEEERNHSLSHHETSSYFCSQIVVASMKKTGLLLASSPSAAEWSVADLVNHEYLNKNLGNNNFSYTVISFYKVVL